MSTSSRIPLPLRRFAALLLTLGVLFTTLGWSHPACAMPESADRIADVHEHGGHADMAQPEEPAPRGSGHCADHEHGSPEQATRCAVAAHCATGLVVESSFVAVSVSVPPAVPLPAPDALPRGPAFQPDSPPPKR